MLYFLDKMARIRFDDILFWILMALIIGTALWLLHGSPTEISAIIAVAIFVACSEILIWRYLFCIDKNSKLNISKIDKNVSISFMKMKNEMNERFSEVNSRFSKIDDKLDNIQNSLNRRR